MNHRRRLILLGVLVVVGIAAATYTWYPRLFPKRAPRPPVQILEAPTPVEVPAEKPAKPQPAKPPAQPAKPKPPTAPVAKGPPEPPKAPPKARPAPPAPAKPRPTRFGLEFPPFVSALEADECERQLKQDGLTTVRSITHMDDGLYAVQVGPFPSATKAGEAMAAVKAKPGRAPEEPRRGEFFFEDGPYNLREVVQRATEIRGKGHTVRIVPVEGRAPVYRIRTATRLDNAHAKKLSQHYRELGCPNRIVSAE